eukprot:scaffold30304_cov40-Cyclotella_meneghiniana.AAC.3
MDGKGVGDDEAELLEGKCWESGLECFHWAVARGMRPIGQGEVVARWYILAALEELLRKERG